MTPAPRHVLHLVDSLAIGGTQTILKEYFESRAPDASVHLYGLRTVDRQLAIAHPNVEVHPSPRRFSIGPLFALRRGVRERGIDVLHCHLFRAQVFGFLLKRLFFPRITLVFHEHGRAVGREGESRFEALMFRWFLRRSWRDVDRFVCISEHTRARLLQEVPGAAPCARVVANPIPVHPVEGETMDVAAIRAAESIPEGAFVVGFASRLVRRKGWADFLAAVASLAPQVPVYFLLAGDGEERALAEARIREPDLAGRGRLLGHVDWMRRFYACLDCFVMPSHWEPHGLAHLEAQSFGTPVVVSRVPGLETTVHDGVDALLFPPGDAQALAACIRRIALEPALRSRLAAGGRANAALYGMARFCESLDALYADAGSPAGAGH